MRSSSIDISSATAGRLVKRIQLDGNALGMTLDASGSRLFVAQDNADQVAVIDTSSNAVVAKIDARAPDGILPRVATDDDSDEGTPIHRRRHLRRDAVARRQDPLRGERRRQLDRGHPAPRPTAAPTGSAA